ncbi:MAG: tRNA guanosine(34) transglycosylase Tgt [Puniceicoccales bacterium]|jgi:queuine tRNA-ribosyltransferase|nr:tRNA guanosine(34) transglycosylase Tgt [Puniceicoccales bacterium]
MNGSPRPNFGFEITHRDQGSRARCGYLRTPHGSIETPNFIFCATKGAMKSVSMQQMREAGAEIILSNTYHLLLRPGGEAVERLGGLHRLMDWPGPLLTDSGGFQIFSLGHGGVAREIKSHRPFESDYPKTLIRVEEEGAVFRSYVDGKRIRLTPELAMETQRQLGADLVLVLDECTPFHVEKAETEASMERSHRWEERSLEAFLAHDDGRQALYGILQGGVYEDLRERSGAYVAGRPFFGQAIGGSLGETVEQMHDVVAMTSRYLHPERPTHLLGISGIRDIWNGVACGVDTFDCVHPTRVARHGIALVPPSLAEGRGFLNLKNGRFRQDGNPVDADCPCYGCRFFTRSYLHTLFHARELLGGQLLTIHNVAFMVRLMQRIRQSLREGRFAEARREG